MQTSEYEQILIKCEYINTVCDSLLRGLQSQSLSKLFLKNKLHSNGQFTKVTSQQKERQNANIIILKQDKSQHQAAMTTKQLEILQSQAIIKTLKLQISQLKQDKFQNNKNNRQVAKISRQIQQFEHQISQNKRLLNFQMQNLNTVKISSNKIQETIEDCERKQFQIKTKINKIIQKQKQSAKFYEMQSQYETLLINKKNIVKQNTVIEQNFSNQISNKISAIAQFTQNLTQMERYTRQLDNLIMQQIMIIDQIGNREVQEEHEKQQKCTDEQDAKIFQKQVNSLRKTIANRKFKQRTSSFQANSQFTSFTNNPTPKNFTTNVTPKNIVSKQQIQKFNSIFKFQIDPAFNSQKISLQRQNNDINDIPHHSVQTNKLKKRSGIPFNQEKSQILTNGNNNTAQEFDNFQVEAIKKILKQKQEEMKEVLKNSNITQIKTIKKSNVLQKPSNNKNNEIYKERPHRMSTEPISLKNKDNRKIQPNSRFIQHLIQQNSPQNINRLKKNIRIRTKTSQTEKQKNLQMQAKINKSRQKKINMQYKKEGLQKNIYPITLQPNVPKDPNKTNQRKSLHLNSQNNLKDNLKTEEKSKRTFYTTQNNQFLTSTSQLSQSPGSKNKKFKYECKVSTGKTSGQGVGINDVMMRIQQIKKQKQSKQSKKKSIDKRVGRSLDKSIEKTGQKIKIFKLPSRKKYSNPLSAFRKGKNPFVEFSQSQDQPSLSKIQEQEESIRNTKQSISNR